MRLELDVQERDAEGRLLAYVWVGDVMANAELIGHGLGQVPAAPTCGTRRRCCAARSRRAPRRSASGGPRARAAPAKNAPGPKGAAPKAAAPSVARAAPGRPPTKSGWSCPLSHPIKADFATYSAERCIYYAPSSSAYAESRTERCYATEDEARQDGCRRSRR